MKTDLKVLAKEWSEFKPVIPLWAALACLQARKRIKGY